MIGCGVPHFSVGEFPHRDEVHLGRERRAVVEGLADQVDQEGMLAVVMVWRPGLKDIQRLAVAEEHRRLRLAHDHL